MAVPPNNSEDVSSSEGPSDWDEVFSRGKISRDEHYQWRIIGGRPQASTRAGKKIGTPKVVDLGSSHSDKTPIVVRIKVMNPVLNPRWLLVCPPILITMLAVIMRV